jgi:hypothetical protein
VCNYVRDHFGGTRVGKKEDQRYQVGEVESMEMGKAGGVQLDVLSKVLPSLLVLLT